MSQPEKTPKLFISYSWDSESHKEWVLALANELCENGIDVTLDQYDLRPGANLFHFMEEGLKSADKILVIYTPKYKEKARIRKGGIGFEYSIINNEVFQNINNPERIIPLLKTGPACASIPEFMQQYLYIDFTNDAAFLQSFEELLRTIYRQQAVIKPVIGQRPVFNTPTIERGDVIVNWKKENKTKKAVQDLASALSPTFPLLGLIDFFKKDDSQES